MSENRKVNGSAENDSFPSDDRAGESLGIQPSTARIHKVTGRADFRGRLVRRALDVRRKAIESSRISLREFVRQSWHVLEPFTRFVDNWHIGLICEYLEAVSAGEILRLVINVPPRHMKSILVTVDFPAWEWTFNPSLKFFCGSYVAALSTQHSVACRRLIESDWYRERWGHICGLMPDQNEKTRYETTALGSRLALQIGTGTGASADRVILDDPNNAEEVESDAARERTIDWFRSTASQRLNDARRSAIVIVMQRLHERDLCGYVLGELGGYTHLCLPTEYEPPAVVDLNSGQTAKVLPRAAGGPETIRRDGTAEGTEVGPISPAPHTYTSGRLPDSIKSSDPRTSCGELLWPARWTREYVEMQKRTLGSCRAAGQLQQRPSPAEGGILKRKWWRFWRHPGREYPPIITRLEDGSFQERVARILPDGLTSHLQSWDLAFKDTRSSAYVVGQVWAKKDADCFLLDQVREKLDFPETLRMIVALTNKWPNTSVKLVEDKANGPAVIATLQSKIPGLIPVEPDGSKEARAHAISAFVESGNVYLPHPGEAPWVMELIEEATAFPNGAYADQVDSMTQALKRLIVSVEDESPDPVYVINHHQLDEVLGVDGAIHPSIRRHLVGFAPNCHGCGREYTTEEIIITKCPKCSISRRTSAGHEI
ncbi:MAG TPA: phage terminase large subunit [Blastocatellia bacterium]